MVYKKNVSALLLGLLLLSGCTQIAAFPYSPNLSTLGPDMQDEMELLLAPQTTSASTPHGATLIGRNE
jgi:hypothetical protein